MNLNNFFCPVCKEAFVVTPASLRCVVCGRVYEIVNGIPDLFVGDMERDFVGDPNQTWLDPKIVEARDTVYRFCARELEGMAFCMQEIRLRSRPGCRILEVGMGTGHFTRWLAEVVASGTEIYAFDFSWPIIEKAKINTQGSGGITLFRANARRLLPFKEESFDMAFVRLAPFGTSGKSRAQAGYELLKPGGWYFEAGWDENANSEVRPTEWAIRQGYKSAEYHVWQYRRIQTEEERTAQQIEMERMTSFPGGPVQKTQAQNYQDDDGRTWKMTTEYLLIAQKPLGG